MQDDWVEVDNAASSLSSNGHGRVDGGGKVKLSRERKISPHVGHDLHEDDDNALDEAPWKAALRLVA